MSQPKHTSRIPLTVNEGVTGALFGLAIIAFSVRTYVRIVLKQFSPEDVMLAFALICLCATTGLTYTILQDQYNALQVILQGGESGLLSQLIGKVPTITKKEDAASTLWWIIIYTIKMAFLLFFRRLIARLPKLNAWWWGATTFTILAGVVCVVDNWLTCPYFTIEKVLSCSGPSTNARTLRYTTISTVLDIVTDFVALSFPVIILWKVRINLRQKLGLGVTLCLSLAMIIVSIVRLAGIKLTGGVVDIVWLVFWQQQEASIAVTMFSISAFRQLFVANSTNNSPVKRSPKYSPGYWAKVVLRKGQSSDEDDVERTNGLPQIPRATLTGMRTVIHGANMSKAWPDDLEAQAVLRNGSMNSNEYPEEAYPHTSQHLPSHAF